MEVNLIEIINILIVSLLLIIFKKKNDVINLLFIVFIYGALHFSFALSAYFTDDPGNTLHVLHVDGGGLLARFSVLVLLGVAFIFLARRAISSWGQKTKNDLIVERYIGTVMLLIAFGYILNIRDNDWLQLKNVISIEAMLGFIMVGYAALNTIHKRDLFLTRNQLFSLLALLIVAVSIAIFEVVNRDSWASTPDINGVQIYRASSILFNPNLFAFWAGLVYLCFAYGMHVSKKYRHLMLGGMFLSSIAMYLSGSRSAGFVLLAVLIIPTLLIKGRSRWLPLLVVPSSVLSFYAFVAFIVKPIIPNNAGIHGLLSLSERFTYAPLQILHYISSFDIFRGFPVLDSFNNYLSNLINKSASDLAVSSIEGRFQGGGVDSGWIVLYQDAGLIGLVAMAWLFLTFSWWGLRSYYTTKSISSVYTLSILISCVMIGLVLRIQVFPVWLFVGVMLILSIVFCNPSRYSTDK